MLLLAMSLAIVFVAGCGGESLTVEEETEVAEARLNFSMLVLDGSGYGESLESLDRMIALYRAKPDAKYDPDEDVEGDDLTMRQVLQDAASELDDYRPDMAAEIDRALDQ
jgi:hypothetical protein